MSNKVNEYDESSIISLGLIEGIKKRPSTFIHSLGPRGIVLLIKELVQNANDEASNGKTNKVYIKINSKEPIITVQDWGRGIPIGSIETILEDIYSGGKYNESVYNVHNGANGMGLMICNVLSDFIDIKINRDNKFADVRYEGGYKKYINVKEDKSGKTGTSVTIKPNLNIFFGPNSGYIDDGNYINKEELIEFLNGLSVNSPGILFELDFDDEKFKFLFTGTVKDYLFEMCRRNNVKLLWNDACQFEVSDPLRNFYGKVVFSFTKDGEKELNWSYMNRFPTVEHGKHVDGVRSGISRAVTQFLKDGNYIPKTNKFTVSGSDIVDNIVDIVMAEMPNPLFDGQTKNKLTSEDYYKFITTHTYNQFMLWGSTHAEEIDKLCKLAVLKAKAAYAAKEAKQQALNPTSVKNIVSSKVDFKNFTDCSGNNPLENELYLCEGLSATSSLVLSRDSKTQAYLALRGKILNVTNKKNPKLTEELQVLISILGIKGYGKDADYKGLRYNKIFIMSDSDPDGSHIASLILGFFLAFYPKLIENGHVFIATPPFYQLVFNKKMHLNILNETYFGIYKREIALKTMDLVTKDKKVINKNVFKVFLNKVIGFNTILEPYAKELNLEPNLLELIVRSFDHLIKGKYKQFEIFGFSVKCITKTKRYRIYYFERGFEHYHFKVDSNFYNEIYVPLYKKIADIKLGNVSLRDKKSGTIYGGTLYNISNCIDALMIGKKTILKRFKGIGELDSDLLRETAMDPKTRKVVKVTLDNFPEAKKWAGILLGDDDIQLKKDLFSKPL